MWRTTACGAPHNGIRPRAELSESGRELRARDSVLRYPGLVDKDVRSNDDYDYNKHVGLIYEKLSNTSIDSLYESQITRATK